MTWAESDGLAGGPALRGGGGPGGDMAFALRHGRDALCVASWLLRVGRPLDWRAVQAELQQQQARGGAVDPSMAAWVRRHAAAAVV